MSDALKLGDCSICAKPVFYGTPALMIVCDCGGQSFMHQLCSDAEDEMTYQHAVDEGLVHTEYVSVQ